AGKSIQHAAQKRIAAANENEGKDNITVVRFRLESDGEQDEEPEDTLGGQATKVGVSTEAVKAAVAQATKTDATKPHKIPDEVAEEEEGREQKAEGREKAEGRGQRAEGGVPVTSPLARRRRPVSAARARRRRVTGLLLLLALGAVVVGLYVGSRQFWFVGTDRGQVALFR